MMPRMFTADNPSAIVRLLHRLRASMMPRMFTADNGSMDVYPLPPEVASMMPRMFTADNMAQVLDAAEVTTGFNDAADVHRG